MEKKFYSISDVSKIINVKPHVIRFWETKFPLIKTNTRISDRRFYSVEQLMVIKKIAHLLYKEGYKIEGVQKAIKEEKIDFSTMEDTATIKEKSPNHEVIKTLEGLEQKILKFLNEK